MNKKIANMIDHTILKATATKDDVVKLCNEAKEYGFFSVCINPANIELAKEELKGSNVKVCTVIGFPLGANTSAVKAFETKDAIAKGADEVDMVINIGALKDKNYELVYEDIKAVVDAAN
ncbi:MAG: deoxyribose-phosphate aldolase, partial [Bacillota bacterium]|nr:deoxyribose-phosphate aldolase [Bacillota bacterium]